MANVLHVPVDHALNRIKEELKRRFVEAQTTLVDMEFQTAEELCKRAIDDLRIVIKLPRNLRDQPVEFVGDKSAKQLSDFFADVLREGGVPAQAIRSQASAIAHRIQLRRAFPDPESVISETCEKVTKIVSGFPKTADEMRWGRNPGDVLDPYILAAAQQLMYPGDFEGTVNATIAHKVLMMIEGLLGHLHEDVLGAMRGNIRAPEPRGEDQETLNYADNPFPGADIVQPPLGQRRPLRFHQVKSKTGSAKGGDGRRLGLQLVELQRVYGGDIYYDALIGNTLRGHRSMAGVRRAAPSVVVLVGDAAFQELTGSPVGPQLLLRVYQSAFEVAAQEAGYRFEDVVVRIYEAFRQRSDEAGEGFLETILRDAITGPREEQDSRHFRPSGRGGGRQQEDDE